MLLSGPPGTGKTLLARAVAGEADVPFFPMSASEFVEMIVGVGASRVRDLFEQAKEAAPAIIFIDELDAIGRSRARAAVQRRQRRARADAQPDPDRDGRLRRREGVIVLGATNRPECSTQALLRPGRFDRRVAVQAARPAGREAILRVHTRASRSRRTSTSARSRRRRPAWSGADLANLANEAALLAARRGARAGRRRDDFTDALEQIVLGAERKLMLSPTTTAGAPPTTRPATRSSACSRPAPTRSARSRSSRAAWRSASRFSAPDADRFNFDEADLSRQIKVALGGRAAEEVVFGDITTGAESDIQQLTRIAREMVGRWGMSDESA